MKTTKIVVILAFALGLATEVANADFTFGEPEILGSPVNSAHDEWDASISSDGLELYFNSNRPGGSGGYDLWVTTRVTTNDSWGEPVNLGPTVNSSSDENGPTISSDGLSLYFDSNRPGGFGLRDLYVTMRASIDAPWGTPINLGPNVNSPALELIPCISADGLSLFFSESLPGPFRPGGLGQGDIWIITQQTGRQPTEVVWGKPQNLGEVVNSSSFEGSPSISADGLLLFFNSFRPPGEIRSGLYNSEIWVTRRSTINDAWLAPVHLGPGIHSPVWDGNPDISADGSTLFFSSTRETNGIKSDLWQAPIIPIVDLNGDGIVDAADMCIIVDHWGEDYSLCDIGPMPWGDGIVDVQDLIILAEHLFEEIPPAE